MKNPPSNVDEYIAGAPKEHQQKLKQMRSIIRASAPKASESISYGMPFYRYKGKLAWFGLAKSHIGLYLRPPLIEQCKKELAKYGTTKSAIHFPLNEELPASLIKKLVKARIKMNEQEEK